jgi:hypothetical protein
MVNNENFPTSHLNNELWEMERNREAAPGVSLVLSVSRIVG